MLKIIADDKIPFLKSVLEPFAEVQYVPGNKITREVIQNADALFVRTRTICNESLLEGTRVRFIASATIGIDHLDENYCRDHLIFCTNAPGCNASSVQQYIASVLFTIAAEKGIRLKDKTLGIVGVGNVGKKVQALAGILGMKILMNDPPRERNETIETFVSLTEIFEKADIISLHVPLTMVGRDKTFHLIGKEEIVKMKKDVWLINTSRGEVVDNLALKESLRNEMIAGAVLDVWENEPVINTELHSLVFLATPHIAGYSLDGKANGTSMVVNALCRHMHLPLKDWFPSSIPLPQHPLINLNGKSKHLEELVGEAVLGTYKIREDDIRLRSDPNAFEKLRGDYPVRREFPAYTLKLNNCDPEVVEIMKKLGFSIG